VSSLPDGNGRIEPSGESCRELRPHFVEVSAIRADSDEDVWESRDSEERANGEQVALISRHSADLTRVHGGIAWRSFKEKGVLRVDDATATELHCLQASKRERIVGEPGPFGLFF
jgi:hypothetical protein